MILLLRILASALVCFLVGSLPTVSLAQPIFSLGARVAPEQDMREQKIETRLPLMARGGWSFAKDDLYLEYSTFSAEDGAGFVTVKRRSDQWLTWVRHRLMSSDALAIPYVAVGAGAQIEHVRTEFDAETVRSSGRPQFVAAFAPGALVTIEEAIEFGIEVRISASATFRPNPSLGGATFIGYRF